MSGRYFEEFRKLELHQKLFITGKGLVMLGGGFLTLSKLMEVLIMKNFETKQRIEFSSHNSNLYEEDLI